jgi:small GTP-binding protein
VFPEDYVPTVFDTHQTDIEVDGVQFSLHLWDTAGQETYDKLRPLAYQKTDCFILCYAINSESSLHNAEKKWMPELKHHCPKTDVVLVGTKMDLRNTPKEAVSEAQAKKIKSKIKASAYIECSARSRENVENIFKEAVRAVMRRRNQKRICAYL